MFNTLSSNPDRRSSLWISVVVHSGIVVSLVATPFLFPEQLKLSPAIHNVTPLVAPILPTEAPRAEPLRMPPSVLKAEVPLVVRELALKVELPPAMEERKESPKLPAPDIQPMPTHPLEEVIVSPPSAPRSAAPAAPPVNKPPREVQTGGFGDPSGVRGDGRNVPVAMARFGSFDLPAGPGTGNGNGGAQGAKGVVTNAGFGSTATGNGAHGTPMSVQQGGFDNARPDEKAAGRAPLRAGPAPTAAEILFKPKPEYTESARNARDEGEVLLRVLFSATGDIRILDIVKGLAHGLNESAVRAAEQIRFKPATEGGKPVDSVAIVHIVFQLAY